MKDLRILEIHVNKITVCNIRMFKVYVDTNIWLDYAHNRDMRAEKFLLDTIKCKYNLIISDIICQELGKFSQIPNSLLEILKKIHKLNILNATAQQIELAKTGKTSHFADRLHSIIADDYHCDFVLTNNKRDFPIKQAKNYDDLRYL